VASLVRSYLDHTRPVSDLELRQAINYGYGKAIKAILAVRPQSFLSVARPFTFSGNVTEYDIGNYDPPFWRPYRLKVVGTNNTRSIRFKYRPMIDEDFQEKEESTSGAFSEIAYDILFGQFPATTPATTLTGAVPTSHLLQVVSTVGFSPGMLVQIVGSGDAQRMPNNTGVFPTTYLGVVVSVSNATDLVVTPSFGTVAAPPAGTPVTVMTRQLLKIAPGLRETLSGDLWYNYRPARLLADGDLLEPMISDHVDMVVSYAMAQLKRAVGDVDSRDYFEDGQAQRSELAQDIDPVSGQNSTAVGTDLWGD
jgi:hypothetical protein